jgi:hypothetical protein
MGKRDERLKYYDSVLQCNNIVTYFKAEEIIDSSGQPVERFSFRCQRFTADIRSPLSNWQIDGQLVV